MCRPYALECYDVDNYVVYTRPPPSSTSSTNETRCKLDANESQLRCLHTDPNQSNEFGKPISILWWKISKKITCTFVNPIMATFLSSPDIGCLHALWKFLGKLQINPHNSSFLFNKSQETTCTTLQAGSFCHANGQWFVFSLDRPLSVEVISYFVCAEFIITLSDLSNDWRELYHHLHFSQLIIGRNCHWWLFLSVSNPLLHILYAWPPIKYSLNHRHTLDGIW